jgi:hypothetical protein
MTTEKRITIDLVDIRAIDIECSECHNHIVRPAATMWQRDIMACPGCGKSWQPYQDILIRLRDSIFQIHNLSTFSSQAGKLPFGVRLELAEDAEEDKP